MTACARNTTCTAYVCSENSLKKFSHDGLFGIDFITWNKWEKATEVKLTL